MRGLQAKARGAALGAGLLALTVQVAQAAPARAAMSYYTTAQAERGAATYQQSCAVCHGADLGGAFDVPPLVGRFAANWAGAPLSQLFDYMAKAMPLFAPGTLTPAQNADLLAFMLRENGAPAGSRDLPATLDGLKNMMFPKSTPASVK
ncbi:c-type cytochrome [Komagataeibacter sucrofermentans]|uniref:Cytochrome C n=1 Tax=Komagataeibacter sucrofermentans TaxID=1053551 RepID=A0A318QGM9_9PROT|nr:cytochrome c [Komagataeibacter sucrofermentans]PYD78766.1 cytochrome C [Komagataeibacter sucrofermentans]GBQ49441.1 cytochrome c [Komagataeibacter sucrofermentans DSM 15973]